LLEKEIQFLGNALASPKRPFYAIVGGIKISTKLGVLRSLLTKVDGLALCGGMAYTFLKALGYSIGDSPCEDALLEEAQSILQECQTKKIALFLPSDFVIAPTLKASAPRREVSAQEGIPSGWQGFDLGPTSRQALKSFLKGAALIFWNGPCGAFECPPFAEATKELATYLAYCGATTIVGGGDSAAAVAAAGLSSQFSHISTGGGASLEYIEFGKLPGVEVLSEK
jgi:phosphoglycerate kinase